MPNKTRLIALFVWFLTLLVACFSVKTAAAAEQKVVILNLPSFDLLEYSQRYPNLMRFISTSATGLVTIPWRADRNDSLGLRLSNDIRKKDAAHAANLASIDGYRLDQLGLGQTLAEESRILPADNAGQKILGRWDWLIGRLLAETDFRNTLVVLCSIRKSATSNAQLASVMMKGLDFSSGVLCSPNTRKMGIITYNDLYSTVSASLHSETHPGLRIKSKPGRWQAIVASQPALLQNYTVRWPLLSGYGYLTLGLLSLLLLGMFFKNYHKLRNCLSWGYLFLLTVPGAFLAAAVVNPLTWTAILGCVLGISGLLFMGSYFLAGRDSFGTLAWISIITAGLIAVDGVFNGYYEYQSFLGYSVVASSRYYGIGNEYMGILLGSYIAAAALGLRHDTRRRRREFLWPMTVLIGLLFIHPNFGADVGGGITALIGLGITNYLWLNQPIRLKEIGRLCVATVFLVAFAGSWDYYLDANSMSHLGQLMKAVHDQGWVVLVNLAARKTALNIRLISTTPLSLVLIAILIAIPFLYRNPPALIQKFKVKYAEIVAGLTGLSVTALVGMITNDSGIVSAAMLFMFGIGLIVLMVNSELNGFRSG